LNIFSNLLRWETSDRDRADVPAPRAVWVDVTGGWRGEHDWRPGLMLEWQRVERRNRVHWEALVIWAHGGGELPWEISMKWMRQGDVRPM
jgi:hypothetical protein